MEEKYGIDGELWKERHRMKKLIEHKLLTE